MEIQFLSYVHLNVLKLLVFTSEVVFSLILKILTHFYYCYCCTTSTTATTTAVSTTITATTTPASINSISKTALIYEISRQETE